MSEETRISSTAERKLVNSVKKAIDMVNDGTDPNTAIAKMAEDQNYGPDFVNRMVEIYNTSRALAHYKKASAKDKANDFPIASAEEVVSGLYPDKEVKPIEQVKLSSLDLMSVKNDHTPSFEKAAHYLRDGDSLARKALNTRADLRRRSDTLRTDYAAAEMGRKTAFCKLAEYFRAPGHTPFEEVDTRVRGHFGKVGELIMDAAWCQIGAMQKVEKRGSNPTKPTLCDIKQEPYKVVESLIGISTDVNEKTAAWKVAKDDYDVFSTELADRYKAKDPEQLKKEAIGLPFDMRTALSTAAGGIMARSVQDKSTDAVKRMLSDLEDPVHKSRLRSIQSEAVINDMMTSDPVISRYDPSDVVEAYNSISQMAPRGVMQPAILRGYLRRMLEGSDTLEPFEIKQLADTETSIQPPKISPGGTDNPLESLAGIK